mgnify:CR=1 FL=1
MEEIDIIPIEGYDFNQRFSSSDKNVRIEVQSKEIGGNIMEDRYVTKDELKLHTEIINSQFDTKLEKLGAKVDGRLGVIEEKINTLETKLDGKFETMNEKINTLNTKIDTNNKIVWWIMGLISAGIIVPAITLIVKIILSK